MGLFGDILGAGVGLWNDYKNRQIADKNYALQEKISQQNYEQQERQLAYQKEAQGIAWQREDNAVTRRVADLKNAGLSPVLAAGSSASSSSPIQVTAPQRSVPQHAPVSYTTGLDKVAVVTSLLKQKADISRTEAENDLINLQKLKTTADTMGSILSNEGVKISNEAARYDLDIAKRTGFPSKPGAAGQLYRDFMNQIMISPVGSALKGLAGKVKHIFK